MADQKTAIEYLDEAERQARSTLEALKPTKPTQAQSTFGNVPDAVKSAEVRGVDEMIALLSTLRSWIYATRYRFDSRMLRITTRT